MFIFHKFFASKPTQSTLLMLNMLSLPSCQIG